MSKAKPNPAHILMEKHLRELKLSFEREVQFHPIRKWRWDYTLPEHRISIEIEGGFYRGISGHSSITGIQRDIDKHNHGVMLGWRTLRFSTADVLRGRARAFLQEHIK